MLLNVKFPSAVALPSLSVSKGDKTVLVVDPSTAFTAAVAALIKDGIHGAGDNILSAEGVSACWNGLIVPDGVATVVKGPTRPELPVVSSSGQAAVAISPNNLAFPASHIVFYEDGRGTANPLAHNEGVQRLISLTDGGKEEVITALMKDVTFSTIGAAADVSSLLK